MPKRPERLVELVQLLGGRRRITISEIMDRFGVSERTTYRDLADLGRDVVPISKDEFGYGLAPGARLSPLNLTRDERRLLGSLLSVRAPGACRPLRHRLATLAAKLERAVDRRGELSLGSDLAFRPLDSSGLISPGVFHGLEEAISSLRCVEVLYRSLSDRTARNRKIDPFILFSRGAWYLVGRCHEHNEPRTFRVDRVQEIVKLHGLFTVPRNFDLDAYLAASWSVYQGNSRHEIEILFSRKIAPVVTGSNHHPSEYLEEQENGSILYRVNLSHLDEIARWILGFGGEARVIRPQALADKVVSLAGGVLETHARGRNPDAEDFS